MITQHRVTAKIWYVPRINYGDHNWVNDSCLNDLPNERFRCAWCGAEYTKPTPTCVVR